MPPEGQSGFAAALLSPDRPAPPNLVDPSGRCAPKRFAVYRNNVTVSLIEALKAIFPAVVALVGEDFFAETARQFVRRTPPESPLLFNYGQEFAPFLGTFPPVSHLPFLSDVARLDRVWLDAYHAADATPFAPEALVGLDEEGLMQTRFEAAPATRLVRSAFPLVTIWQAARSGTRPHLAAAPQAESALVTRPDVAVGVTAVSGATAEFFAALMAGKTLGSAAETALAADPGFDLPAALGLVISGGGFAGVHLSAAE